MRRRLPIPPATMQAERAHLQVRVRPQAFRGCMATPRASTEAMRSSALRRSSLPMCLGQWRSGRSAIPPATTILPSVQGRRARTACCRSGSEVPIPLSATSGGMPCRRRPIPIRIGTTGHAPTTRFRASAKSIVMVRWRRRMLRRRHSAAVVTGTSAGCRPRARISTACSTNSRSSIAH